MKSQTEVLWTEFSRQLKQFILKRVSDEAIAEDILQDVFVKIHANVEALEDTSNLWAWIYQITRKDRRRNNFPKIRKILAIMQATYCYDVQA